MKAGMSARSARTLASQLRHAGYEDGIRGEGRTYLAAKGVRRIGNVRIAQQQIIGCCRQGFDVIHALLDGPELAGPAFRKRLPAEHGEPLDGVGRQCCVSGRIIRAIRTLIVHKHDGERAGIVLMQQGADGGPHNIGFVSRRDDCHHGGPAGRGCLWRRSFVVAFAPAPESAMGRQQIEPGGECESGCGHGQRHPMYPACRNHAIASASPSANGRAL